MIAIKMAISLMIFGMVILLGSAVFDSDRLLYIATAVVAIAALSVVAGIWML